MLAVDVGEGRPCGDDTDARGDKGNAQPAGERNLFMKDVVGNEGNQDITERCCREDICEIGPGESRHIGREKGKQQQDSQRDPGVGDGQEKAGKVVEGDGAELLHAAGEQGIAERAEDGDSDQNEVFAKRHLALGLRR